MTKLSDVKNKLKIRRANIDDVQAIYETIFEAFESYKKYYTREAYEMTVISHIEIEKRIRSNKKEILVAVYNNEVVGTATIKIGDKNNIHIQSMAVRPEYQEKGIGLCILEEINKLAQKKGCKTVSLECFHPLRKAISLYEKCGFNRTGKTRDYYGVKIFEMLKDIG